MKFPPVGATSGIIGLSLEGAPALRANGPVWRGACRRAKVSSTGTALGRAATQAALQEMLKTAASGRKQKARIKQRPQPIRWIGEGASTAQRRPSARAAIYSAFPSSIRLA